MPSSQPPVVLVVGDLVCDRYVWGDVDRISPEAPVQIVKWTREADRPGGAANVAANLAALGCRVRVAGLVGADTAGRWLVRTLHRLGADTRGVVTVRDRPTAQKTRVIARGQHLLRIDREDATSVGKSDEQRLLAGLERLLPGTTAVVCSDYGKGVLGTAVLARLLGRRPSGARSAEARRGRSDGRGAGSLPLVIVDPKGHDFSKYRGADLITPNEKELIAATPDGEAQEPGPASLSRRVAWLLRQTEARGVLVTRGAQGMDLFLAGEPSESSDTAGRTVKRVRRVKHLSVPVSQRHDVFDVTGAGDTVVAVMAASLARGVPWPDATRLANAAAGIVVSTVGTSVIDAERLTQVVNAVDGGLSPARSKVLPRKALKDAVTDARRSGARVVFTNGCFDLLHAGHLNLLQQARALGDLLIVAVNDDTSARRVKGPRRPLVPGEQRAEMLAALRFVDYVTLFGESTPLGLLRALRPDVLVKGAGHTLEQVVGRRFVEGYGGRVVLVPELPNFSSARLVETIQQQPDRTADASIRRPTGPARRPPRREHRRQ